MDRRYRVFFAFAAVIFAIEIIASVVRFITFAATGKDWAPLDPVVDHTRHFYAPLLACMVGAAFREQSRENAALRQALANQDDGRVNLT